MEIIGVIFSITCALFGFIVLLKGLIDGLLSDFFLGVVIVLVSYTLAYYVGKNHFTKEYEYHINVNMKGYTLYSSKGDSIGFATYGNNKLDTLILNDNQ